MMVAGLLGIAMLSQSQAQENVTVAIDTDTTGNTATSLGDAQACNSISVGQSLDIDVVVDTIPPWSDLNGDGTPDLNDTGGLQAFQFMLLYDPQVVEVTAVNNEMLIAANGVVPIDLGDTLPDRDGRFELGFADLGFTTPEDGAGVLSRISLTAVGVGQSNLDLSETAVVDMGNDGYPLTVRNAAVSVGQPCTPPDPLSGTSTGDSDTTAPGDGAGADTTPADDATGNDGAPADDATGSDADSGGEGPNDSSDQESAAAGGRATPATDGGSGLGTGAWLAITFGSGAAAVAAGLGGWLVWRRRRSS